MTQPITIKPFSELFSSTRTMHLQKHSETLPMVPSNFVVANLIAYSAALFVLDTRTLGKALLMLNWSPHLANFKLAKPVSRIIVMTRRERYQYILDYFQQQQPAAETELKYSNHYELAVAVILSGQCTDKRVNMITPVFFSHFPDVYRLAESSHSEVFEVIKSCSYPNNKSRHLIGFAKMLVGQFNGVMPSDVGTLQRLPGIGRKSANVILSVAFGIPAMAVDTHVFRVASRLGLTVNAKNPLQAERQLVENIPEALLSISHHWLILHGRYICKARKPLCENCPLTSWCVWFEKNKTIIEQSGKWTKAVAVCWW